MVTEAKRRATKKWNDNNLESIQAFQRKGTRARWKAAAEAAGMSLAALMRDAIEEKIARDGIQVPTLPDPKEE